MSAAAGPVVEHAILTTGCVVLVGITLVLARALRGPTVFDRVLAANAMGTKTVLFLVVLGFMLHRPEFVDIVLVYALVNFVVTIAILSYVERGRLG